jgi:hypothetical protein
MEQAFKPLGLYLDFWHPTLTTGQRHRFSIAMVNDEDRKRTGKLRLSFVDTSGKEIAYREKLFSIDPLGAETWYLDMQVPDAAGSYSLQAVATPVDDASDPTISHRDVTLQPPVAH